MKSNQYNIQFWKVVDQLLTTSRIRIDRPRGSRHPRFPEFIYPVDYGYLENTMADEIRVKVQGEMGWGNIENLSKINYKRFIIKLA